MYLHEIPAGFTYQSLDAASGVTVLNSTTVPVTGATGTVTFEGGVVSGINSSYTVPAAGSIVLKYTAVAPATQASGLVTNAKGFIGTTQFGVAQNTVNVSATLPVRFISFTANCLDDKTLLEWTTASETNTSFFEIEKGVNGNSFYKIGEKTAGNISTTNTSYIFTDFSVNNKYAYRLKIVDQDSKYRYSPVVYVRCDLKQATLTSVYPNPFSDNIQFSLALPQSQPVRINLIDADGKVVYSNERHGAKGSNAISIDQLDRLSTGLYFLQIITDKETLTKRLIKNN